MAQSPFDPEALPVADVAGEPPLPPERLHAAWLRARFADPPRWHPEPGDALRLRAPAVPTRASVLIALVERADGLHVLLTLRTDHLSAHAGQISFPGGRAEDFDASPLDTALRETEEEIGLHRRYIDILGVLPDYLTATGFQVTPVVALVAPGFELNPDANEVAEIFDVPLAFLMNGGNHQRRALTLPDGGGQRSFYAMPYERYFIWGATAGMLRNLFHFLAA